MKREEINQELISSDVTLIRRITGIPDSTIRAVLKGERTGQSERGRQVLETAAEVVKSRRALLPPDQP